MLVQRNTVTKLILARAKGVLRRTAPVICGLLGAALLAAAPVGCGSENVFELLEQPESREKGETALANGDYDAAISNLEDALAANPNDVETRKLLATAYMAKSELDTFQIVQKLSTADENSDWNSILTAMPDGSEENRTNLSRAVSVLEGIPEGQRTDEERYQLAMAQTALAVSTAKKYGVDENGQVSDDQAAQITDADAELIVGQLDGASSNMAGLNNEDAATGGEKIGGVSTRIKESEGDSQAEKLRSFLASENQ